MDSDGLDIALTCLALDFEEDKAEALSALKDARSTSDGIRALDARTDALNARVPSEVACQPTRPSPPLRLVEEQAPVSRRDWETIVSEAKVRLRQRGIDPGAVSLDDLLDPEEVERIEQRFSGGFTIATPLDRYDIAAAVAAGLVAALVDFLIVRIPRDIVYLGVAQQEGSPVTKWLRSMSVPQENWLARHFKVSYDEVNTVKSSISGFGPKTHRLQTFGHDPLVGLVVGTIDIMRGGLTAMSKDGRIRAFVGTGAAHYNPFTAFVWQMMHLLSDGFTKMGLPAPGWPLLQLFQIGSFGEKERTVAELARFTYLKGYDSRHFLTMSTSVAAAEVVLRGYFWVRRKLDEEYDEAVAHEGEVAGATNTGGHPRFQGMALAAHALATAANAGKVAIYAVNPLAINYAQWLRFFHAAFEWMRTNLRSPSEVLRGHARANWKALEDGWPELDVQAPAFPTLVIEQ